MMSTGRRIFVLLAGCTGISRVPEITAAGASPDLTFLTPVVDSEIISSGQVLSMKEPPMTPDGIPTPAIVTAASLKIAGVPALTVNAGLREKPMVPYIETGLDPAVDPREGPALPMIQKAISLGKSLGTLLDGIADEVFLAESVPGGTTTAYLVLRAIGYNVSTSSTLPSGSDRIKEEIWNSIGNDGQFQKNPIGAVENFGDYMMALALGISRGMKRASLHYCGGTQMATVYRLDRLINNPDGHRDVITTGWVMDHRPETMRKLSGSAITRVDISFRDSQFLGLRKYEEGHVREGAGMGAAYHLASGSARREQIMDSISNLYAQLGKQTVSGSHNHIG